MYSHSATHILYVKMALCARHTGNSMNCRSRLLDFLISSWWVFTFWQLQWVKISNIVDFYTAAGPCRNYIICQVLFLIDKPVYWIVATEAWKNLKPLHVCHNTVSQILFVCACLAHISGDNVSLKIWIVLRIKKKQWKILNKNQVDI